MDVTALLNSTAGARSLPPSEFSQRSVTPPSEDDTHLHENSDTTPSPRTTTSKRAPTSHAATSGSRIPWDAGGYSLAQALEFRSPGTAGKSTHPAEPSTEGGSPYSTWHKMSESHSSRSSHASSSSFWSQPHSRLSSISTVNGLPTIPDVSTLEIGSKSESAQEPGMRRVDSRPVPLSELPLRSVAEHEHGPISPSDAVMMIRSHVNAAVDPIDPSRQYLHVHDPFKHKRTISAPDFACMDVNGSSESQRTAARSSTPSSDSSDITPTASLATSDKLSTRDSKTSSESPEEQIRCMYVENCDTNSSLRKAISHIFGRNKLCTRMIPAPVWVHYCRKHYQRSRYRNAQEYAKLQAELVQRQVMRIQAWSDNNKTTGQGSVVINWSISMRKREQNRVQEKSKKRSLTGESEDEDDCADRAVANGTAVPDWLREKCGEGYSTMDIQEITSRLKENVANGTLAQIPDIEILPNISADPAEDGRCRNVQKRRPNTATTHRRAQSVSIRVCPPTEGAVDRSAVHAIPFIRTSELGDMFPARKRHRAGTLAFDGYSYAPHDTVPRGQAQRPTGILPLSYGLPHRPAMTSTLDNYCTSPYDDMHPAHAAGYAPQRPALAVQQARLPFARPLSPPGRVERSRRMSHGRSHSEISNFAHHSDFTFRTPPPMSTGAPADRHRYPSPHGSEGTHLTPPEAYRYAPRSAHESEQDSHRLPSWLSPSSSARFAQDSAMPTMHHQHARHLSTPVAFRDSPPMGGSLYEQHYYQRV